MTDETSRTTSTSNTSIPADASESLNDALDSLEDMLQRRQVVPEPPPDRSEFRHAGIDVAESDEDGPQYSIPLLRDVVMPAPGKDSPQRHGAPVKRSASSRDMDFDGAVSRLAERLSSEIDVIIQTAIEEALENARSELADKVRDHLDITLPELLEELVNLRQRD